MWITKTSINHPVFATMVMVAIVVLGLFSYRGLGVQQLPDVQPPGLWIEVGYPGASPEAVENDITRPVEEAVNTVSGVKTIRSNSWEGRSGVAVEFSLSTNMDKAIQDVRDKIGRIRPGFPREAKEPFIVRFSTDNDEPIAGLGIMSSSRSIRELSTLTDQVIVKRLQAVQGVGAVNVNGALDRQVQVLLRPERLTALNVGVDEVMRAIQLTNQDLPAGAITRDEGEQLVRIEGKLKNPRDFGKIIVARRANVPVTLDQVADIRDGEREERSIARINGQRAIGLSIIKMQDANVVQVGKGVREAVEDLKKRLPKDVEVRMLYENSQWIEDSLAGVKKTILEGAALTVLIVFLFLHSWRSTIITGLTLPISVIASFIALKVFGFTLNFLTLMALSLCIGLLIDDAIVVRENIMRHLGMGKKHHDAARDGTEEIGLAVMATTFAIVAVFVPIAFMDGIMGKFFFQFGVTVAVAVLVSLFVSFTLDPMLSAVWHDPPEGRFKRVPALGRLMDRIEHGVERLHVVYGRVLDRALKWRKLTLLIAMVTFVGSFFLVPFIGSEFMPQTDQGYISLNFKTPVGSSLQYTDAKVRQAEEALKAFKEIEIVDTRVGTNGINEARVNLKLTDARTGRKPQKEIEAQIRDRLKSIGGLELSVGWGNPIFISILGQDTDKLKEVVEHVQSKIATVKGVVDLKNSMEGSNPTITVKVNNELASDLGVSLQQVGAALRPFLSGDTVSRWLAPDGQNYEVNVQLPKSGRQKVADLADLSVASTRTDANGRPVMVPLRQFVEFVPSTSPQVIKRQDLQRRVSIYANVEGRPAGDVGNEVQKLIKTIELPPGYRFDVGGQSKEMQESFMAAVMALGIAVIFIYLVLASQFGSFLQPIAIMVSLPFSLTGVLLALLVTGSTLNLFSIIGFIMLMGLVTKNAILLVDFANQAQKRGLSQFDALREAGQVRLRPILMTTLAMIFGMLPMALGVSQGSEMQAPMGRAVIGGIITSTLMTLVVVPVAYTYLDSLGKWVVRHLRKGHPEHAEPAPAAPAAAAAPAAQ